MTLPVHLAHRAIVSVGGDDAVSFLDGLLTQSMSLPDGSDWRWAALLTPQGKIIVDLLVRRTHDGFLLDAPAPARDDLIQRLTRYRLRARVEIAARADLCVAAFAGDADPRSPRAPQRTVIDIRDQAVSSDLTHYNLARIAAGVAEAPLDLSAGEVFPADINMDLLGGVDFRKGCFVGQEVVSRMKRRGTARRRTLVLQVEGETAATLDQSPLLADEEEIGVVTSSAGQIALARVRIDRLGEAEARGLGLTVRGRQARVDRPSWLDEEIAALRPG